MSIDHFYSVKDGEATRLKPMDDDLFGSRQDDYKKMLPAALASADDVFVVRMNHGGVKQEDGTKSMCMIDDLYFFGSRQEAQEFIDGGYRKRLYVGEDRPDSISSIDTASSFFRLDG